MCNEWKEVDFPDAELRFLGTAILNEIIGDMCRHYLFTLKKDMEQKNFFFTNSNTNKDKLDAFKKICVCVNNVIYIKKQVIDNLDKLLNYEETVKYLSPAYNEKLLNENLK